MRPRSHSSVHVLLEKSLFLCMIALRGLCSLALGRQVCIASLGLLCTCFLAAYQFSARASTFLELGHRFYIVDALPSLPIVLPKLEGRLDDLSDSGLDPVLPHCEWVAIAVEGVLLHASSVESQLSVLD